MDSVPKAKAAIAVGPPTLYTISTPAISQATKVTGGISPFFIGGVVIEIDGTPATFAGIAIISTVDG